MGITQGSEAELGRNSPLYKSMAFWQREGRCFLFFSMKIWLHS